MTGQTVGEFGWKRGWFVASTAEGGVVDLVCGAFAGPAAAVPMAGQTSCVCPEQLRGECYDGFNAHRIRTTALRYRPLTATLLRVELSGRIRAAGPEQEYLVAERQRVLEAEVPYACLPCLERPPATREVVGAHDPWQEPTGLAVASEGTVRPVCDRHAPTLSLEDMPAPTRWASPDIGRWTALRHRPHTPTRCLCRRLSRLSDSALRFYIHNHWTTAATRHPAGGMVETCDSCGVRWHYRRDRWPSWADQLRLDGQDGCLTRGRGPREGD